MAQSPNNTAPANMQNAAQQYNMQARNLVLRNAVEMTQRILNTTFTTGMNTQITVPVRNVGLIKKFIVKVSATISGSAGVTHTLTKLGAANFFSQVVFTDLSNLQRINTSGWHLQAVASAKARLPYGSAITATDTPFGFGNNYTQVQSAPPTITASTASSNVFLFYEIPVAYSDDDLRGAVYAGVVNATMQLQLTVNPNLLVGSGVTDAVLSMYQSSSAVVAAIPSFTVVVYQIYLDQIPVVPASSNGPGGPVLPPLDISTAYFLNNSSFSGISNNQLYPIPYSNFRDFLSTIVIYDNGGTLNAGSDLTTITLTSANLTNILDLEPTFPALLARLRLQDDFPTGMYYFDHRRKPISTVQYGNMQLNFQPNTVNANAQFLVGFESFGILNQVTNAGSLAGS